MADRYEPVDEPNEKETAENAAAEKASGFGAKSIGMFASICLITNNITGPGMVQIPNLYQSAGWLFPTVVFVVVGIMCYFISMYLAKAITQVPGNKNFERRMEFNDLARQLFPRWLYLLTMWALIFNFQASNISSIVVSAQTMDSTLIKAVQRTCALVVYPPQSSPFECISQSDSDVPTDSPFGSKYVISLGYLVIMVVTIPLGFVNLDDNLLVQEGGFILLCLCMVAWLVQFIYGGLTPSSVPVSDFSGYGQVLSTVVFNFGYLTTLPSWLNEKKPEVSISRASWVSIVISATMFFILGFFGGMGLPSGSTEDLLAALNDPATPNVLLASQIATYVFPIAALVSGIPVFSIIIRYNLINEGVPRLWANLFAVLFPWAIALFFYAGNLLTTMITWSSALIFVYLNLILPLLIYTRRQHMMEQAYGKETVQHRAVSEGVQVEDDLSGGGLGWGGSAVSPSASRAKLITGDTDDLRFKEGGGALDEPQESELDPDGPGDIEGNPDILVVPRSFAACCLDASSLSKSLLVFSVFLGVACLGLQISSVWISNA